MAISRREFIAAAAAPAFLPAAATHPNFIVIVADDLGCHDLGCLGAADLKTPHIDALAASGARFVNWYSNAPVCAPARSSIMTGRVPVLRRARQRQGTGSREQDHRVFTEAARLRHRLHRQIDRKSVV